MFHFESSLPIVTRGSRFSRAPLHHTLPAFINLNGTHLVLKNAESSRNLLERLRIKFSNTMKHIFININNKDVKFGSIQS